MYNLTAIMIDYNFLIKYLLFNGKNIIFYIYRSSNSSEFLYYLFNS